jgi:hypothetical protein
MDEKKINAGEGVSKVGKTVDRTALYLAESRK